MTEVEILDSVVGGMRLRDMSSLTFYGWMAGKINGLPVNSAAAQEIRLAVQNPPMTRSVSDDTKVRYVQKLLSLGITL